MPSSSWGKCVPGQTAGTPKRTDAQHARCFTQLPRPRNSFIGKGRRRIAVQPPAFSGCTARIAKWRGLRGRASLSDRPRAQPPPGTILVKSFPPGSHHGFHVQKPQGSPRQSPAWPLWPSEPLELPGTDSLCSRTICSSYKTSSRNNASLSPDQALELQDDQLPKEPAPCTTTWGAPTPTHPQCPGPHFPWSAEAWASLRGA